MTAAAWHPDPTGKHELRYWDGNQWTDHVSDQGVVSTSSLAADNSGADSAGSAEGTSETSEGGSSSFADESPAESPLEADDVTAMATPSYAAEPQAQPAQQPYQQQGPPPQQAHPAQAMGAPVYGDAFAGISGDLIDGRFSEVDGVGAQLQNHKLLRVRVQEPFMAKQGSMVAYQGNVNFAYQGGGAAKFLKKAVTGEGLSLMRVEGQGDVFLADLAHDVHVLNLNNSGLSVNGKNVLAFSSTLDWNVERVKGGSIAAGGLFNTTLRGTGWVAITTEGSPVVLNAQEAPTFADANALVAWSVQLQTSIRSTMSAGALIGRGSGEAFQVSFSGPGFVIVQPSEGPPVAAG